MTPKFKPFYKKLIRLKKNIRNDKIILKFKKKKWNNLINFIKNFENRKKKKISAIHQDSHIVSKSTDFFNNGYFNNLLIKKRFALFYGSITNKNIAYFVKVVNRIANKKSLLSNVFINLLESRIDSILYRVHFFKSIRQSRLSVKHGHISVNGRMIKNFKYLLRKGDRISVTKKNHTIIKTNLYNSSFLSVPPSNIKVNYRTLQIIMLDNNVKHNISNLFSFHLGTNDLLNQKF